MTSAVDYLASLRPRMLLAFVFLNREPGEDPESDHYIRLVRDLRLPLLTLSSRGFKPQLRVQNTRGWRRQFDRAVDSMISVEGPDAIFLAGYMLIASGWMCRKHVMLNLHPALPGGPKGSWQEVVEHLIVDDAKESGVQVHRATSRLDSGPVVTYCKFSIPNAEDESARRVLIRQEQLIREIPLIQLTLGLLSEWKGTAAQLVQALEPGIDMTSRITQMLELAQGGLSARERPRFT